jgi:hypothetical protein
MNEWWTSPPVCSHCSPEHADDSQWCSSWCCTMGVQRGACSSSLWFEWLILWSCWYSHYQASKWWEATYIEHLFMSCPGLLGSVFWFTVFSSIIKKYLPLDTPGSSVLPPEEIVCQFESSYPIARRAHLHSDYLEKFLFCLIVLVRIMNWPRGALCTEATSPPIHFECLLCAYTWISGRFLGTWLQVPPFDLDLWQQIVNIELWIWKPNKMALKFYFDLLSQPVRATYIFLKMNNIPFTPKLVNIGKGKEGFCHLWWESSPWPTSSSIKAAILQFC